MREIAGQVAVVTGAASGIGLALAERFVAEGAMVVLADVEQDPLERAAARLADAGGSVLAVRTDVRQLADIEALADRAEEAFGPVHILCNNAGVGTGGAIWELSAAEWEWVVGVDLWGVIHGVRVFVPRMLAHGGEGHVVNTASMEGLVSTPGFGPYAVSKHGVIALSEILHHDLALRGAPIKVSVLCPGWVNTRIVESDRNQPAEVAAAQARTPETDMLREIGRELIGRMTAGGMAPAEVADHVLRAMREERFYVLTHPDWVSLIRLRMDDILEGRNPTLGVVPGLEAVMPAGGSGVGAAG